MERKKYILKLRISLSDSSRCTAFFCFWHHCLCNVGIHDVSYLPQYLADHNFKSDNKIFTVIEHVCFFILHATLCSTYCLDFLVCKACDLSHVKFKICQYHTFYLMKLKFISKKKEWMCEILFPFQLREKKKKLSSNGLYDLVQGEEKNYCFILSSAADRCTPFK